MDLMKRLNSIIIILLFTTFPLFSQYSATIIKLWNGKDFTGWEFISNSTANIESVCKIKSDSVLEVSGKSMGYLATIGSYENYKLHLEYRWPMDAANISNSGVLIHIASPPIERNTWPRCFQIQTKITRTGDVLPMAGAQFAEPLSSPPETKIPVRERQNPDCENSVGKWNTMDIICSHRTIECQINGVVQNRVTKCEPHSGKIGIQFEGFPFELRNIWLNVLE